MDSTRNPFIAECGDGAKFFFLSSKILNLAVIIVVKLR